MACYNNVQWPWCAPDGKQNFDCSAVPSNQNCCLSAPTTDFAVSNCPAGWESQPKKQEWCTSSVRGNKRTYRHKCQRKQCPKGQDPQYNCSKCLDTSEYPRCDCSQDKQDMRLNWDAERRDLEKSVETASDELRKLEQSCAAEKKSCDLERIDYRARLGAYERDIQSLRNQVSNLQLEIKHYQTEQIVAEQMFTSQLSFANSELSKCKFDKGVCDRAYEQANSALQQCMNTNRPR